MFLRINQVPKESKLSVDLMEYANHIEKSNKEAVQALKREIEVYGEYAGDKRMCDLP